MKGIGKGAGLVLALALMLTGCAGAGEEAHTGPVASALEGAASALEGASSLPDLEEPGDLEGLTPADLGCLEEEYPTRYGSYPLLPGDELENTVYTLTGEEEGPVIYIVGGTHGDELAGWYAGILLRQATLRAGQVYLVAPLNRYGAEHQQRRTQDDRDLNRAYPGDPEGTQAQRIAHALYQDLADKKPDLVLDLHEARLHTDGRDNLGNSIICQDMSLIPELVLDLLSDSDGGALTLSQPLTLYGSPPEGSLNRTATLELGIPVITVETFREEELSQRVANQLHIAEYVFSWYNMR